MRRLMFRPRRTHRLRRKPRQRKQSYYEERDAKNLRREQKKDLERFFSALPKVYRSFPRTPRPAHFFSRLQKGKRRRKRRFVHARNYTRRRIR